MADTAQQGFLVLADISGYTSYLSSAELEHANGILSDLLEAITEGLIPPLVLSKLEGDAVFAYVADERLPRGETLLEAIDKTYLSFRDKVEAMRRGTTCECNACRAIPTLDLKFIVHHGTFLIQRIATTQELLGSDVTLAHRLLKNHVGEATGWHAYALFTKAGREHLSLGSEHLHEHTETYEHLGAVETYSYDLRARYQVMMENRRVFVTPEEADFVVENEIDAAVSVVWDWLNDPQRQAQWLGAREVRPILRPGGRSGVGARNHCMHGKMVIKQTIVDWKPFDYFTIESPGPPVATRTTYCLQPEGARTRLRMTVKANSRLPRGVSGSVCKMMFKAFKAPQRMADLTRLAEDENRQLLAIA